MLPPLHGVRVLDLTQVLSGPYCTMILADLGAEVVKLEQPGRGDDLRRLGRYRGRGPDDEDYFYALNRRKKSIALDLKRAEGRDLGRRLAQQADVVVENFSPGTAARLGMGWDDLRSLNPRLVYCSISGFGQDGPYRDRLALDPIIQGMSGLMSVTGDPAGDPAGVGAPLCDIIAAIFAANAIVGALYAVQRDGQGRFVDLSMLDAMLAALGPRMAETLQAGRLPTRMGIENPLRVPSGTYRARDGRLLNVIVSNERHWAPFCRALDRQKWLDDPRFATMAARVRHRAEMNALVDARFAELTGEELMERFLEQRVPAGPVNDYAQALADPQVAHRGLVRAVAHPKSGAIRLVGPPWRMSGQEPPFTPPPLLGEHTDAVLHDWLGISTDEIASTRGSGVL